jgi:Zn ribbon nucleic-acid-binding protein
MCLNVLVQTLSNSIDSTGTLMSQMKFHAFQENFVDSLEIVRCWQKENKSRTKINKTVELNQVDLIDFLQINEITRKNLVYNSVFIFSS